MVHVVAFLGVAIFAPTPVAVAELMPRHVLLLNSYNQNMSWVAEITRAVEEVLEASEPKLIVHIENMDTKRVNSQEYYDALQAMLAKKYAGIDFSAIIASDDNAVAFAWKKRPALWPGVPIVFCGVNDIKAVVTSGISNHTGVLGGHSPVGTVEAMLALQPQVREVFVINDYLKTGRSWAEFMSKELEVFEDRVHFSWNEDLPLEDLHKQIAELQPHQAVLLGVYFSDRDGRYYTYEKIGAFLTKDSPVPVYTLFDFYVGHGAVGGEVTNGYTHGEQAALLALQILAGAPADSLPIQHSNAPQFLFDWEKLRQYNLNPDDLPEGCKVINKQPTFYERYYFTIWLAGVTLFLLLLMVVLERIHTIRQKGMQKDLALTEERYRQLVQYARSIIMQMTADGRVAFMNEYGLKFFGWTAEELVGRYVSETLISKDILNPQQLARLILRPTRESYVPRNRIYQVLRRNGQAAWVSWAGQALFDEQGAFMGLLLVGQDDTGRQKALKKLRRLNRKLEERVRARTAELQASFDTLEAAQAQLIEAEKMASLGGLLAGVAHEVGTPLNLCMASVGFLEEKLLLLEKQYTDNIMKRSDLKEFLELAKDSTRAALVNLRRSGELIQSVKQVAVDQGEEQQRTFYLRNYLEEVLLSLRSSWRHTTHTVSITGQEDIFIYCDPGVIMQIVTNLVSNALIHGFDGMEHGTVTIDTHEEGENVILAITDNGKGMDKEVRDKVFEPFFSTRKKQGGIGLGLHIVYNLVIQHLHGTIVCTSEPGQGTTFTVTFPK